MIELCSEFDDICRNFANIFEHVEKSDPQFFEISSKMSWIDRILPIEPFNLGGDGRNRGDDRNRGDGRNLSWKVRYRSLLRFFSQMSKL